MDQAATKYFNNSNDIPKLLSCYSDYMPGGAKVCAPHGDNNESKSMDSKTENDSSISADLVNGNLQSKSLGEGSRSQNDKNEPSQKRFSDRKPKHIDLAQSFVKRASRACSRLVAKKDLVGAWDFTFGESFVRGPVICGEHVKIRSGFDLEKYTTLGQNREKSVGRPVAQLRIDVNGHWTLRGLCLSKR